MTLWELFLVAVSLAMDAFAVAVCKGLSLKKVKARHGLAVGLWFGLFQAAMPLIGFFLVDSFAAKIAGYSFVIAFALLLLIGLNMIREAFGKEEGSADASLAPRAMLPLALATSIDAFAVGVSFALLGVKILPAVSLIGAVTFLISAAGVLLGSFVGRRFEKATTVAGGAVLVLMGIKILLEGLGVL